MHRTSKISRLPRPIREELNQRLDDSLPGPKILEWLNSLPEVQATLAAEFDSAPITTSNLHHWRHSHFRHWQIRRNAAEFLAADAEDPGETRILADSISRKLSHWLYLRDASALHTLTPGDDDPTDELRHLHDLCADIVALRRGDLTADRVLCEQKRIAVLESASAEEREKLFWEWTARPEVQAKLVPQRSREEARREAERVLNFKLLGIPYEPQSTDEYSDPAVLI